MRTFLNYITVISLLLSQTKYSLGSISYVLVVLTIAHTLFSNKVTFKLVIGAKYFILLVVIILSLLVNDIPSVFNSYSKFLGFITVLLLCSNLINNRNLTVNKILLLPIISNVSLIFTSISFLGLVFGYFPRNNENEIAGGFSGIFNNSIYLAAVSSLVIIYYFYKNSLAKKLNILSLSIISIHFYIIILTGSRSSLIALILALSFYILKLYSKQFLNLFRKYWYLIIIITGLLFTINTTKLFAVFINKSATAERLGSNSRQVLWDNRLTEFRSNPVFGIGFNSVNLNISTYEFKEESGSIEPGSSWLFVLSTLGLLGIITYFWILSFSIKLIFSKNSIYVNYLLALLVFFVINMIFEGYIFAVGNILAYVFYLTLSNLSNVKKKIK